MINEWVYWQTKAAIDYKDGTSLKAFLLLMEDRMSIKLWSFGGQTLFGGGDITVGKSRGEGILSRGR